MAVDDRIEADGGPRANLRTSVDKRSAMNALVSRWNRIEGVRPRVLQRRYIEKFPPGISAMRQFPGCKPCDLPEMDRTR